MDGIDKLIQRYADETAKVYKQLGEQQDATKAVQDAMRLLYVLSVYHHLLTLKAIGAQVLAPKEGWQRIGIGVE